MNSHTVFTPSAICRPCINPGSEAGLQAGGELLPSHSVIPLDPYIYSPPPSLPIPFHTIFSEKQARP